MSLLVITSLLVLQVLLIFVHLAVYATAAEAFGIGGPVFQAIFIFLSLTFLSASILAHWYKGRILRWYYAAAAYWFGLINFLFGGAVAFFFVTDMLYSFNYYVPPAPLAAIFFGLFFLLHLYGTWKSGQAGITRIDVALTGLPAAWRGKKIVFVSDLHLGNVRRDGFVAKVVRKIKEQAPEAVFIGGDLYDGVACDPAKLIEPLRELRPPRGVYFVTGNHEYFLPDLPSALAAIRGAGIRILEDEKVDLGGLSVVGVNDYSHLAKGGRREEHFKKVLRGRAKALQHEERKLEKTLNGTAIQNGHPAILLKHEPTYLDAARDAGVALGLFGHTHHGQIFPLNYLTQKIYRGFDYGLHRAGNMQAYTSSGVGTWGPPLRLGTKSEIVLITLR